MEEETIKNKESIIRWTDLWGKIDTITTPPTYTPKKISEQIVLVSGTPSSLYAYDFLNNTWKVFGSSDNS